MMMISCPFESCIRFGTEDCKRCKNNLARHKALDQFVACNDSDFSKYRMRNGRYATELVGSAEQGGYKCPACHYLNNAYLFNEETRYECEKCGLPLTLME